MISKLSGLDKKPWLKLPVGTFWFFKQCGFSSSEIEVVLFFFYKLERNMQNENYNIVFVDTEEIVYFCAVSRKTLFLTLKKMKGKGLIKIGNGKYDLSKFMEEMEKRAKIYILGQ